MKPFVFLLLLITLTSFTASLNPNIVNGKEATENQFPHQVGLYIESDKGTGYFCGGSLISPTFVITAAHCVVLPVPVDNIFVLLGSIYLDEGIQRDALNFIVHPEYAGLPEWEVSGTVNDIALIEIDYVNYSDSIMNIALSVASEYYPDYESSVVIVSGWGRTNYTVAESSPTLRYTTLLVIRTEACAIIEGIEKVSEEVVICAASPIDSGACSGDSGGPLVHSDSMVLIGIVSAATNNCTGFYLNYFTSISNHRQWIWEMIGI